MSESGLHCVTFNTGRRWRVDGEGFNPKLAKAARAVVAGGGGTLRALGETFQVEILHDQSVAAIQIRANAIHPLAEAVLCRRKTHPEPAWAKTLELYLGFEAPLRRLDLWGDPPAMPPSPWLGTILLPPAVKYPASFEWLDEAASCLAWTILAKA